VDLHHQIYETKRYASLFIGIAFMKQDIPIIRPKQLIAALERAGFVIHRVTGSHYILKHPAKPALRITVPFHNRDLKRGTLQSIVKQSGFTNEEFSDLL